MITARFALLALFAVIAPLAHAAEAKGPALQLRLSFDQEEYVLGEPATVTFRLTDPFQTGILVLAPNFDGGLDLWYKYEMEVDYRRALPAPEIDQVGRRRESIPAQGLTFRVELIRDARRLSSISSAQDSKERISTYFLREGRYLFFARSAVGQPEAILDSNVATVTVRQPTGVDAEAWPEWRDNVLKQSLGAFWDMGLAEERAQAIAVLKQFLEHHPEGIYARHARTELARMNGIVASAARVPSPNQLPSGNTEKTSGATRGETPSSGAVSTVKAASQDPDLTKPVYAPIASVSDSRWLWAIGALTAIAVVVFARRRRARS